MIKANELRIGNYILFKQFGKGKGKIGQMKPGDFGRVGCDDPEESEYHPISLTPEWLALCGLVAGEIRFSYHTHISVRPYQTAIQGVFPGEWQVTLISAVPHPLGTRIKYLHQLQNLYYILTGEELQIKLP